MRRRAKNNKPEEGGLNIANQLRQQGRKAPQPAKKHTAADLLEYIKHVDTIDNIADLNAVVVAIAGKTARKVESFEITDAADLAVRSYGG